MTKTNQELLLKSLNWTSGEFVPNCGYFYKLINDRFIFFPYSGYPFKVLFDKDKTIIGFKKNKENKYIIDDIEYRIPKLKEIEDILEHRDNSSLSNIAIPVKLYVSDYPYYYFDTITNALQPYDFSGYQIYVLVINSIQLNTK